MRTLSLLLLACGLWASPAPAQTVDRVLVVSGAAFLVADWSTTTWGLRHGQEEANPLLGTHPSRAGLAVYNVAVLSLYTLAVTKLPRPVARLVAVGLLAAEATSLAHNLAIGDRFAIP